MNKEEMDFSSLGDDEEITPLQSHSLLSGDPKDDQPEKVKSKKVGRPSKRKPGVKYKTDSFILPEPLINDLKVFVAVNSSKNITKSSVVEKALIQYLNEQG